MMKDAEPCVKVPGPLRVLPRHAYIDSSLLFGHEMTARATWRCDEDVTYLFLQKKKMGRGDKDTKITSYQDTKIPRYQDTKTPNLDI